MMTRAQLRAASAERLNGLSRDELFYRWMITRLGNVTGLDVIGVPTYTAVRPEGKVISVSCGKHLQKSFARAGAIAEAIEHDFFEKPSGDFIERGKCECEVDKLPLARGSAWTGADLIPVEPVTRLHDGKTVSLPRDLLWMVQRIKRERQFQTSSNGQAVGAQFEDAFLAGLYECVERDAVTLWEQERGRYPRRIDYRSETVERCRAAGLKAYLFDCTLDIKLPVYAALLFDPEGDAGNFKGSGCALIHSEAAERAILEAVQSRAVYISGARDDILRRNFECLKRYDPREWIREIESLPRYKMFEEEKRDLTAAEELDAAIQRVGDYHKKNIYYKHWPGEPLHAVKVIFLGLEQPILRKQWQPLPYSTRVHRSLAAFLSL